MRQSIKIAIAGLGTVGGGTLTLLRENAALIEARCGRALQVVAVSARDEAKAKKLGLDGIRWVADARALADDPEINLIVEVIGGADGVAKTLVEKALANGKSVVTANKALIAHHGVALAAVAEKTGAMLAFEAAVAGGIPIIKALRDGLAANRIERIAGILNGTCNYILTTMSREKRDFAEVLKEAQTLGYAEADPSFDIDGIDTAHKLAILASLAYGTQVNIGAVHVEGIRRISARDIEFAGELGYAIKLLGIAQMTEQGLMQRVHPAMVPLHSPLGGVDGVFNAVQAQGSAVGSMMFEGRGAGAGPTASSVVADVMDIARGVRYCPFTLPAAKLSAAAAAGVEGLKSAYYLRLAVIDRPGVLAEVTSIFRDERISMRSFLQHSHQPGEPVQLALTTHETEERLMNRALERIAALDAVEEKPQVIRIEQ